MHTKNVIMGIVGMLACMCLVAACGKIEWFPDTTQPNHFTFATKRDVKTGTVVESDPVQLTHNLQGSKVTITNGEWASSNDNATYSAWTSQPGRVVANQYLKVRHTSSSSVNTETVTTINVQDYTTTFTSVTASVFSNVSTASPPVTEGKIYDSTNKVAAFGITATETTKDATSATTTLKVTVSNTGIQAVSVSVLVQGKDSTGMVLETATLSGTVGANPTDLAISEVIPIAIYNSISSWVITKVTLQ